MDLTDRSVKDDEQTIVYRLYGEDDALLYVGLTSNLHKRLIHHRFTKSWFDEVRRAESLTFSDATDAARSEALLIATQQPRYNRSGRNGHGLDAQFFSEWSSLNVERTALHYVGHAA